MWGGAYRLASIRLAEFAYFHVRAKPEHENTAHVRRFAVGIRGVVRIYITDSKELSPLASFGPG